MIKPPIGSQRSKTHTLLGGKKFEKTKNWPKPIWRPSRFPGEIQFSRTHNPFLIKTHTSTQPTWEKEKKHSLVCEEWRLLQALRPNGALCLTRRARLERVSRPRKRNLGRERRMGVMIYQRNARRLRVFASSTVESTILRMGRLVTRYLVKTLV